MRIVIVKKEESITDESSNAIERECKRCGKKFVNKGVAYCSKDCQLMDGNWNFIEISKCYNFRNNHHLNPIRLEWVLWSFESLFWTIDK